MYCLKQQWFFSFKIALGGRLLLKMTKVANKMLLLCLLDEEFDFLFNYFFLSIDAAASKSISSDLNSLYVNDGFVHVFVWMDVWVKEWVVHLHFSFLKIGIIYNYLFIPVFGLKQVCPIVRVCMHRTIIINVRLELCKQTHARRNWVDSFTKSDESSTGFKLTHRIVRFNRRNLKSAITNWTRWEEGFVSEKKWICNQVWPSIAKPTTLTN